jgi:hypothetical protein
MSGEKRLRLLQGYFTGLVLWACLHCLWGCSPRAGKTVTVTYKERSVVLTPDGIASVPDAGGFAFEGGVPASPIQYQYPQNEGRLRPFAGP